MSRRYTSSLSAAGRAPAEDGGRSTSLGSIRTCVYVFAVVARLRCPTFRADRRPVDALTVQQRDPAVP